MIITLEGNLTVILNEIKYIRKELKQLKQIDTSSKYVNHEDIQHDIERLEHKQDFMNLELKKCKGAIRRLNKVKEFS